MFTKDIVLGVIQNYENSDNEFLFRKIFSKLEDVLGVGNVLVKKVGKTEVKYLHISKDVLDTHELTRGCNLGTSHSERYYFFNLKAEDVIFATETGGGYINRGYSAYHISLYPIVCKNYSNLNSHREIYSTKTVTPNNPNMDSWTITNFKINNINQWHEDIRLFLGIGIAQKEDFYDLSKKELLSYLRSTFTTNRFSTPVLFSNNRAFNGISNDKLFVGEGFMAKNFNKFFKGKIKKLLPNTYRLSEDFVDFLVDSFEGDIVIEKQYLQKNIYDDNTNEDFFKEKKVIGTEKVYNGISDIIFSGEVFDKLYKDKLSLVQYYLYFYDRHGNDLLKVQKGFKFEQDKLNSLFFTIDLKNSYSDNTTIGNLNKLIENQYTNFTNESIENLKNIREFELNRINNEKEKAVLDKISSLKEFFKNSECIVSFDYSLNDYNKDSVVEVIFNSVEEIDLNEEDLKLIYG